MELLGVGPGAKPDLGSPHGHPLASGNTQPNFAETLIPFTVPKH
jgi:hypothetical protein